jgi:hypothetical protein
MPSPICPSFPFEAAGRRVHINCIAKPRFQQGITIINGRMGGYPLPPLLRKKNEDFP